MKNIRPFESFVNEEVTDTYLRDKIAKAKEGGRQISANYQEELYNKRNRLEDTDRTRKVENDRRKAEEDWKNFQNTAEEIQTSLRQAVKTFNVDGIPFKVSQVRPSTGPTLEIHLTPIETQKIDRIVISYYKSRDELRAFIYYDGINKSYPMTKLSEFFGTLTQVFKKYFPKSKFADRKTYSALESNVVKFEDFENVSELFGAKRQMKTKKNLENIKEISDKQKKKEKEDEEEKEEVNEKRRGATNPTKKLINSVFRKYGIKPVGYETTSVRGFGYNVGKGYKYEYPGLVTLKGVPKDIIDSMTSEMKDLGVKIGSVRNDSFEYSEPRTRLD